MLGGPMLGGPMLGGPMLGGFSPGPFMAGGLADSSNDGGPSTAVFVEGDPSVLA